jgi:hypothetical protein
MNWWWCLLPGFPGRYTWTQVILVSSYICLFGLSFTLFTLSIEHEYCIYPLAVKTWMALCFVGLVLSSQLVFSYFFLLGNRRPLGDARTWASIIDVPRFWISLIACYFYSNLSIRILFIYLYTLPYPQYAELLDQGLSRSGYYGFTETRLLSFLNECQLAFQIQFIFALFEYILLPMRHKIMEWLNQGRN